jgi:hypothetical protein
MTLNFNQIILEQAMHITDGLTTTVDDKDFQDVLSTWDKGCLELFTYVSRFAEPAAKLLQDKLEENKGFSGVFEYEVSNTFGMWIAKYILVNKDVPPLDLCNIELNVLAYKFFSKGVVSL